MSASERYGIAIALSVLALGVVQGMTGAIPAVLGWPIVAGCLTTATVLIVRGKRGRQELSSQGTIDKRETLPNSWRGLSEAEFAQVQAATISMRVHHGHVDFDGLVDDQKHGKPLNGSCWRCGKPRFEKGGPLK